MAHWDRATTPWRQGQLLTTDTVRSFGLNQSVAPEEVAAVVISHDCDIAQSPEVEPTVEIIIGRYIERPDGNLTHGKNPRRLHIKCEGEERRWIELTANRRSLLLKESDDPKVPALVSHVPAERHLLEGLARTTLQVWLAARYRRSAFADEFDKRLKDTGVAERLVKLLSEFGEDTHAIFFDIDEGTEVHRKGADDPYELHITLLYDTKGDPQRAQAQASKLADGIRAIFENRCRKKQSNVIAWTWIELTGVEVVADTALSFAESELLTKWNVDHISLRPDP